MNGKLKVLRIHDAVKILSLSRSAIYQKLATDPNFPRPIKLSDSNSRGAPIGFIEHEIEAWIKHRIELRDS